MCHGIVFLRRLKNTYSRKLNFTNVSLGSAVKRLSLHKIPALEYFFLMRNILSRWLGGQFFSNQPTVCVKSLLPMVSFLFSYGKWKKLTTLPLCASWHFSANTFSILLPNPTLPSDCCYSLFHSESDCNSLEESCCLLIPVNMSSAKQSTGIY